MNKTESRTTIGGIDAKKHIEVHQWIRKHYGRANRCESESCDGETGYTFHWSLLKGKEYENKRKNFWQLCPKCHYHYDRDKIK